MINLGDLVRDKVSGFEGKALAMEVSLYESPKFRVQPTHVTEIGEMRRAEWFEVDRLDVVSSREPKGFLPKYP